MKQVKAEIRDFKPEFTTPTYDEFKNFFRRVRVNNPTILKNDGHAEIKTPKHDIFKTGRYDTPCKTQSEKKG